MKRSYVLLVVLLISLSISPISIAHAQSEQPVVHAVLFYSPTCGHCQYVITNTLLPLIDQYGDQLQIIGVDVSQQQAQAAFMYAMQKFNLESAGVPFLVVDNLYLIGSEDIPEKFPGLVENYLAQGGVDWPDLPGLEYTLNTPDSTPMPTQTNASQTDPEPATDSPASSQPLATPSILGTHNTTASNWRERFALDPTGNSLSVLVLGVMLGAVTWTLLFLKSTKSITLKQNRVWIIPLLSVIGFVVAGYLTYVETSQVTAICGPVGDCNTVQQSEYAHLFGFLPIGVLGLFGYLTILIAWDITQITSDHRADFAAIILFILTAFGTLFSIYLTFLEPFVIGATCAWCLTSSILMTILMLLSVKPAKISYSRLVNASE